MFRCEACGLAVEVRSGSLEDAAEKLPACQIPVLRGPGDFLHNLLQKRFGAQPSLGCGCARWVRRMNHWGPEGCQRRVHLIAERLRRQALRDGGWKGLAAHLPGARLILRQIVLEAIALTETALQQAEQADILAPQGGTA